MACIDTQLFLGFLNNSKTSHPNFMDFLEYVYTQDSSMIKKNKDGKIIAVCAEIDIETKIDCDIACENLIFKEKVKFDKCEFKGKVSFKNCTFEKQVIFSNSLFKNNVYFDNSTFKGYVDFHESNFMSITSFYGINFQKVPNFSACYFKESKAVNLVNIDINNLDFKQVENFIDDNYKDKTYEKDKNNEQNSNKPQEIEQKHKLRYAQNAKDSFRVIKDILIEQNNTLEAQEWHKLELYAREKEFEIRLGENNLSQPSSKLEKEDKLEKITPATIYNTICKIINKIINGIILILIYIPIFIGWLLLSCVLLPTLLLYCIVSFVFQFVYDFLYVLLKLFHSKNFLLFMTRFIKYKTIKIYRIGKNIQDYTAWVDCILLQFYRNTSDHHTNFVKILNFTVVMIALYAGLCFVFSQSIDIFISIDFLPILFLSSYGVIIIILFLYWKTSKKFLMLSLTMIFTIFAFLFISGMTFLSPKSIVVFFLMCYLSFLLIFYTLFICDKKLIVFLVKFCSYIIFLGVIVLKPQFINPLIGIFPSDALFETRLERRLNALSQNSIINLTKISQKDFTLQNEYQKEYNVSIAEINSAKVTIIENKTVLNNVLSFLFDEKKINNFKEILATLENNASNLPNVIKSIDDKNNNSALFFDMRKLLSLDFVRRADDIEYNILRDFPLLSITPKDEEYQIFESQENQNKLKNILSIINLDSELELQSIKRAIDYDEILSDTIKSTSVIYSIILLLCIFSLQKTARKNSIIPS